MYKTNETDLLIASSIQRRKKDLSSAFRKNFELQEKTLGLFILGINHAQFNEFDDTKFIWNIAGFINIISLDLKVVGQDLMLAENEWQKRYYARQASLIIYESMNDFFDLLGKDFKLIVSTKICDNNIEEQLLTIRKDLNFYKTEHYNNLHEIRNIAIAHRDNNSLKQINKIQEICWSDIIELVTNYDKILNQLGELFQQLINIGLAKFEELQKK